MSVSEDRALHVGLGAGPGRVDTEVVLLDCGLGQGRGGVRVLHVSTPALHPQETLLLPWLRTGAD